MKIPKTTIAIALLAALLIPLPIRAQTQEDYEALKKRIEELEAKTAALEKEKAQWEKGGGDSKAGAAEEAAAPASKIKLSDSITEMSLYGDLRLRYQYDQSAEQQDKPDTLTSSGASPADARPGADPHIDQRSRERFRLRLGADVKFGDQFFAGFELSTSQSADTNMQTFTEGFDNYGIYIYKVFLGWKPEDWLTVIAGKQDNPFYTTDLYWGTDVAPQGLVEKFDVREAFFPDSKQLALRLLAAQFIFEDNNEYNDTNATSTDAWIFSEQLQGTWQFNKELSLTLAPGANLYNSAHVSGLLNTRAFTDVTFQNYTAAVQTQTVTTTTDLVTISYDNKGVPSRTVAPVNVQTVTTVTNPSGGNSRSVTASTTSQQQQVKTVGSPIVGLPQYNLPVNPSLANQTFTSTQAVGKGKVSITNPQPRALGHENGDLTLLVLPGDISFKLGGLRPRIYWDLAYNLDGKGRFDNEYGLDDPTIIATQDPKNPSLLTTRRVEGQHFSERDALAWLVGIKFGDNRKAGDFSLLTDYREIGIASEDPNVNDSTIGLGALNLRIIRAAIAYNLTDFLTVVASYEHGWHLDSGLIGGQATSGASIADLSRVDVFQLDMNLKF